MLPQLSQKPQQGKGILSARNPCNHTVSRLQHIIDHTWKNGQLYLILCGSSMSFMEYQVLGYESPLYGRRTGQYKIQALTYKEMTAFNPTLTNEQQSLVYGITGGLGFLLAIFLFAAVRESLEFAETPKCFEGFPIALITAGLLALAFMGFSGMVVWQ